MTLLLAIAAIIALVLLHRRMNREDKAKRDRRAMRHAITRYEKEATQ